MSMQIFFSESTNYLTSWKACNISTKVSYFQLNDKQTMQLVCDNNISITPSNLILHNVESKNITTIAQEIQ